MRYSCTTLKNVIFSTKIDKFFLLVTPLLQTDLLSHSKCSFPSQWISFSNEIFSSNLLNFISLLFAVISNQECNLVCILSKFIKPTFIDFILTSIKALNLSTQQSSSVELEFYRWASRLKDSSREADLRCCWMFEAKVFVEMGKDYGTN